MHAYQTDLNSTPQQSHDLTLNKTWLSFGIHPQHCHESGYE